MIDKLAKVFCATDADAAGSIIYETLVREAWRVYRRMQGRGWPFGRVLAFAWCRAREARDLRRAELAAFDRSRWAA